MSSARTAVNMSTMRSASSTSQIHDGFATIRTRNGSMHRSRSSRSSVRLGGDLQPTQQQQQQQQLEQLQLLQLKSSSASLGSHSHSNGRDGAAASAVYDRSIPGGSAGADVDAADEALSRSSRASRYFDGLAFRPAHRVAVRGVDAGVASSPHLDDVVTAQQQQQQQRLLSKPNNTFKQSMSLDCSRSITNNADADTNYADTGADALRCRITNGGARTPTPSIPAYTRPLSPTYCNVEPRQPPAACSQSPRRHPHHQRSATAYSDFFQPTYYRKDTNDPQQYALMRLPAPPPPTSPLPRAPAAATKMQPLAAERPRTLHYQTTPSTHHQTPPSIFAANPAFSNVTTTTRRSSPSAYYSADTNYYSPAEILIGAAVAASATAASDRTKTLRHRSMPAPAAAADKRFATLSYPRESQRLRQLSRMSHVDSNDGSFGDSSDYINDEPIDTLDCKIGSQTTLRSKPPVPWYELAIRKPLTAAASTALLSAAAPDRRRQSCPPTYEVCMCCMAVWE